MAIRTNFFSLARLSQENPNFRRAFSGILLAGVMATTCSAGVDAQLVAKGLARQAKQADAEYDQVSQEDAANCTGSYETRNGVRGLLIVGSNSQALRWLSDTNGDGKIDQLSFFRDGVEVYRDIDSDYDDKIDQSRWMGTAGMRWGVDKDQDGTLDTWKMISAEEVTSEVVQAVRDNEPVRFQRLLLTKSELVELGLGKAKTAELTDRLDASATEFKKFANTQKTIDKASRWASFGADKPGLIPAGTEDSTTDVLAYENVMAVVETRDGPQQLMIGTLVKVGESWRLLDVPRVVSDGTSISENGLFFSASNRGRSVAGESGSTVTAAVEKLIKEMEAVEEKLKDPKSDKAVLHSQRADILEKLIANASTKEDIQSWTRQLADQVLSAVQSGEYPDGIERLKRLDSEIALNKDAKSEVSYVAYRVLQAEYNLAVSEKEVDYEKVQKQHLKRLESFVDSYPQSLDSADAMIHLGLNSELINDLKIAQKWYERTSTSFPKTPQGEKAKGALLRLDLKGKEVSFAGKTLGGKPFTTAKLGRPVLVHYWATWCGPCKADMQELKKLQTKYAKKGLVIVGINADNDAATASSFLQANKQIDWVQLYEPGGLESGIAAGLGVFSLPVTILIDKDGKVAESTSHYTPNVEATIESLLK